MTGCFFGRKPPPEIGFLLRVLDAVTLDQLAALYGEARDTFDDPRMREAVNKRMAEVIAAALLAALLLFDYLGTI